MLNRVLFAATVIAIQSCAWSEPKPLMTNEKFNHRTLANGQVEFVFGVSWRGSLSNNNGRDSERGPLRKSQRFEAGIPAQRFAMQTNNQTKLELEDQAALSLTQRIKKEQLCTNGYEITEVIWRNDNIRLLGQCL